MTSDGLVLVFFVSYRHGRNSGAICCWKYELMPTYLEIRVLIGHVRSFRHRNNRLIICSWRCIGFVLFVPFIVQGFKFIEQTFGPENKDFFRTCNVLPFSCTYLALRQGKRSKVHAKQKGFKNFFTCKSSRGRRNSSGWNMGPNVWLYPLKSTYSN